MATIGLHVAMIVHVTVKNNTMKWIKEEPTEWSSLCTYRSLLAASIFFILSLKNIYHYLVKNKIIENAFYWHVCSLQGPHPICANIRHGICNQWRRQAQPQVSAFCGPVLSSIQHHTETQITFSQPFLLGMMFSDK